MGDMGNMHAGMNHSMMTTTEMNHGDHGHHGNHGDMEMDHSMNSNMSGGHMMMMYFHTGASEFILFKELQTTSVGEMVGACVCIFALAVLYEGLKVLREQLLKSSLSSAMKYREVTISTHTSQDNFIVDPKANGSTDNMHVMKGPSDYSIVQNKGIQMISSSHLIQTALHVLQVFISYCLMLVFMTYNVWLCLSVVLGAGAGYFLFGWKRAVVVDVNEHCH